MMETGTGKTYTYTKTIFELNKQFEIFKFIIIVPTLSIKAGTVNFLKSESCREHFRVQYNKTLHLHIVESQKNQKSKKSYIPPAIISFVNSGNFENNNIQVLIINAGMINSETLDKSFDKGLLNNHTIPWAALASTCPFLIIDEPHKFGTHNKTWTNIQKLSPQFILRYGATFPDIQTKKKNPKTGKSQNFYVKDYHNLVYKLTAVDSFNQNLVKGVIGHITEFETGRDTLVKLVHTDGMEAVFECIDNGKKISATLTKKESLQKIHIAMSSLYIENMNKNTVVLSNGLEMKKGDKIHPYSYDVKLQEIMIQKAIKLHFELEKSLLTRKVKIKPITLFFIDNIDEYRNPSGYIRTTVEMYIKAEVKHLLKTETEDFYRTYLEKTWLHVEASHAGYFSKDNTDKDEAIEKEINEILHDKEALLDINNPRRFIFSKWTLREGWDNPNVFQICKLRSSGSDISKLQEVCRGLRLPVNEYGHRVKDEQFYLHYLVDFSESDFVDRLVKEIYYKSGTTSLHDMTNRLSDDLISKILKKYNYPDENTLLNELVHLYKVIDTSLVFVDGGLEFIQEKYSKIFEGLDKNKVYKAQNIRQTKNEKGHTNLDNIQKEKNKKRYLTCSIGNELDFKNHLTHFLNDQQKNLNYPTIQEVEVTLSLDKDKAFGQKSVSNKPSYSASISTMRYSDFLKELSISLNVNIKTLHQSIIESEIDINTYLNPSTIRVLKQNFEQYLPSENG